MQGYEADIASALADYNAAIADGLKAVKKETELQGGKFNTEISQILTSAIIPQIDPTSFDDADALDGFFVSITDKNRRMGFESILC